MQGAIIAKLMEKTSQSVISHLTIGDSPAKNLS